MPQKGIVTYGVAPNRQKPLAGAMHDAIFNTWRRFSSQVLYFAPPMIAGYYLMSWAIERYAISLPPPSYILATLLLDWTLESGGILGYELEC